VKIPRSRIRRARLGLRRGRWTIKAAIDEAVPVPVLSAALYERFSSRGEADYAGQAALRDAFRFGGHLEKAAGKIGGVKGDSHERFPLGRTRFLRRHRRSGLQEDFSGAASDGEARHLDVPVIGVAKAGWNLEQLRARAKDSLEKHGGIDRRRFRKVEPPAALRRRRLPGPATFAGLRKELEDAQHPAHYLAIPPLLFETVVEQLGKRAAARALA
jgi:hypothetical protein